MHQPEKLQAGDQVRARCSLAHVPEGSAGIVQRVFYTVDLYDVLFDEQHVQYVLHRRELELEAPRRVREASH